MVIDVIDLIDSDVALLEADLRKTGSAILRYGGMCNGVGQMVSDVLRLSRGHPSVEVLRIWSHGVPGNQGISLGVPDSTYGGQRAGLSLENFPAVRGELLKLAPCFAARARVELRGCSVAANMAGRDLIRKLARLWNVPVFAPDHEQEIQSSRWIGPVYRADPKGVISATALNR